MIIDTAFIVAFLYGGFMGMKGKLFSSALNGVFVFVSFLLAMKFSYVAQNFVYDAMPNSSGYAPIISFGLMFFLILILMTLVGRIGNGWTKNSEFSLVNKGFGMVLWLCILSIIVSALCFYGGQSDLLSQNLLTDSTVYPYVDWVYPAVQCHLSSVFPAIQEVFIAFQNMMSDFAASLRGECA